MNKRKSLFFIIFFISLVSLFSASTSNKVYATAKGKKYHYKTCRTLKKSKNLVELTISQAKQKGLKPCKVCNPPTK